MSRSGLLLSRLLRALWFRPALYAAAALAALLAAPSVATLLPDGLMKLIGLDGVYDLLNALASTLLSVAIFSLGILAASMRSAAQGATPRVRPLLAEDRTARNAISTFIGGFVFSVVGIVILSTGYYSDAAKVLMFFITCVLILALIVALLRWIGRLGRLGGVPEAVDLAEEATRKALLALAEDPFLGGAGRAQLRLQPRVSRCMRQHPASFRPSKLTGLAHSVRSWTSTCTSKPGPEPLSDPGIHF